MIIICLAWPVAAALVVDRRLNRSPLQTSVVDSINIVGNSNHITTHEPADLYTVYSTVVCGECGCASPACESLL